MKTLNRSLFTLLFMTMALLSNAQIKVHDNGQVSLGSLNTTDGVQVNTFGQASFRSTLNSPGHWTTMVNSTMVDCKHWVVKNNNYIPWYRFYVDGNGIVYRIGEGTISDPRFQEDEEEIEDAVEVLEGIDGFYYNLVDDTTSIDKSKQRHVGLSAVQVEKALPEAVRTDENGIMYVDYEVMTVFLLQAVKEQQKEIKLLRDKLDKNGLLK